MDTLSPARIMEVGMAFWPAKVLLSAVEIGLFTKLGANAMTGADLQLALGFEVALQVGDVRVVAAVALHLVEDFEEDSEDRVPAAAMAGL